MNPNNPGAGLSYREMLRVGEPFCTLDDLSSLCKLPPSREVSLTMGDVRGGPQQPDTESVQNLMTLYYAQFVVHETMQGLETGSFLAEPGRASCGKDRRKLWKGVMSPNVDALEIACDDPFYSQFDVQCLDFVRNRRLNEKCVLQEASFVNSATAVLDLNTIYQIFNTTTRKFDSMQGVNGKIRTGPNGTRLTPYANNNQHTILAALDYFFVDLHDLIADELLRLKPSLTPDMTFQTARQILTGFYQHVFYNEILALFIGTNNTLVGNAKDTFNNSITPQIIIEYTNAAGRLTHFLVTDNITIANCKTYASISTVRTRDTFNNVDLAGNQMQGIICGAMRQAWNTAGVSPDIQNFLFYDPSLGYGSDLISVDNERSRDACFEPYINYLKRIFNVCIKTWSDLRQFMSCSAIRALQKIYKRLEDVELYPGGLAETPVGDSIMGPTFTYLTLKQYEVLKAGDKKFYSHSLKSKPKQLAQIVKMTLQDMLCIGAKLEKVLKDPKIRFIPGTNPVVNCKCKTLKQCFDLSVFL